MSGEEVERIAAPAETFEALVGELDYSMIVVTAAAGGRPSGCLIGFATQCSISPPRFVVYLSTQNRTFEVACRAEALGVHFLSTADEDRYSYEARYEIGRTDFICPAELGVDEAAVTDAATATWKALDCAGFVRVDLILSDEGPEVLEVNAVPGLTDTSLFPMAAEAAGTGFSELCGRVVELALARSASAA